MKRMIILVFSILFVSTASFGASSTADLSSGPAKKEKIEIKAPPASIGSRMKSDANLYYVRTNRRSVNNMYRDFRGCDYDGDCERTSRTVRSEVKKASDSRKYNLNNPFYQPLALQFASVTDLSYGYNSLDFMILENSGGWANNPGNYSASNFSITENLSFGITDDVIILGQIRLASSKLNIHWDLVADPMFSDDKQSTNKMDLMGAGVQWRVVNDSDWIASIMGAIQSLTDAATVFTGEAKLGYKNDDTTIYWFGRVMFYNWDGTSGYGFGLKNQHGQTEYFSTVENVTSSVWYDLGMGIFAALNSDWSADIQLTYSGAEWHNQISGRAGISYQSWKNASIGFYGRVALWDSADKFDKSSVLFMQNDGSVSRQGTAAFSNYSDFALGVQLTATF